MTADHRIVLADCLGPEGLCTLADKSVDHVITDPPYSEHVHTKSRIGARLTDGFSRDKNFGFGHMTAEAMDACAQQVARVTRRWVLVFCDVELSHDWRKALAAVGLDYVRTCAWVKLGCTPQFSGDRPAAGFEAIVIAHTPGRKTWNGGGKRGIYSHEIVRDSDERGESRVHTTQKPLALMESLVADFTDPGELICDPFAGSGTTGVAAKRLGRRFVGWERDPKYHAIAQKRIDGAREQLGLFREKVAEPKQAGLALGAASASASGGTR